MPDKEVKTIKDLILYQYAKIIANSALGADSKKQAYGFIKRKFRELRDDKITWSGILREDKQLVDAEKKCVYCGSEENLQWEHIVPKSLKINDRCSGCGHIQGIHNQIWACRECNSKKATKGLYHFMKELHPENSKFYDVLPPLLEKKYLKTIWHCHECNGTLDWDGDGKPLTVLDLDIAVMGTGM